MSRNNTLPSYEDLLEFQEVYLRAVALAWSDHKFKEQFLKDPRSAMADTFSYMLPWNVDFRVKEANSHEHRWHPQRREWTLPRSKISFGVPKKPEFEVQLVAFAAYNDAGPNYLFTCC